jgi:endonuclease/exonuclease/phosphatase family metal-dependent hydrolase
MSFALRLVGGAALAALMLGGGLAEARPSVSILGVGSGETIAGHVAVEAKVEGSGIARVEFSVDGRRVHSEFHYPYCMAGDTGRCAGWNSRQVANGRHTITATVYDRAGRKATASAEVTVRNGDAAASGSSGRGRLKVMSYNVHWGIPNGRRLDAVAKTIAASGADVAGVQELRRFTAKAKLGNYRCEDQPRRLARALEELTGREWHWTFVANTTKRLTRECAHLRGVARQEGVAIFSRYPIVGGGSYRLAYEKSLAKAVVDVPGAGRVTVYTVHLTWNSVGKRVAQAKQIAGIIKAGGGAAFLTGDLNDQPGDPPIRILTGILKDSGGGPTRRSKLDYVMYRGGAHLEAVRVIQSAASDHRPIVGTFSLH